MSEAARVPPLLKMALISAAVGALVSLALFVRAGPYTLVTFMFVAQPLLGLAMVLFAAQVFRDLRRGKLL